jgi:hypothetical protein
MPNFRSDLDEAEQRDAAARSFTRLQEWTIKDGERHYLRFVTKRTIHVDVHRFIPTKEKPSDCDWTKWPSTMWAVCQKDQGFRLLAEDGETLLDGYEEGYGDCYIHTAMAGVKDPKYGKDKSVPDVMIYGLAAIRKAVLDPNSKKAIGLTDDTVEVKDASGDVHTVPRLVIVGQKYSQLWGAVNAACFLPPNDMRRMDFLITRKENDLKVSAQAPIEDLVPGTPAWERYEAAIKITNADLEAFVLEHASPDHYAKFFIPGAVPKGGYKRGSSDTEATEVSPAASAQPVKPEVSPDTLADMRSELTGRSAQTTPSA